MFQISSSDEIFHADGWLVEHTRNPVCGGIETFSRFYLYIWRYYQHKPKYSYFHHFRSKQARIAFNQGKVRIYCFNFKKLHQKWIEKQCHHSSRL